MSNQDPSTDREPPLDRDLQRPLHQCWRISVQSATFFCVAFMLLDAWLLRRTLILSLTMELVLMSILFAQCALMVIFAATWNRLLPVRFIIVMTAIYVCLALVMRVLGTQISAQYAAVWAIWIVTFALCTIGIVRFLLHLDRWRSGIYPTKQSLFAFDLRLVMRVTLVVAILFAFGQYGQRQWTWEFAAIKPNLYVLAMVGGAVNAIGVSAAVAATCQPTVCRTAVGIVIALLIPTIGFEAIRQIQMRAFDNPIPWIQLTTIAILPTAVVFTVLLICRRRKTT